MLLGAVGCPPGRCWRLIAAEAAENAAAFIRSQAYYVAFQAGQEEGIP